MNPTLRMCIQVFLLSLTLPLCGAWSRHEFATVESRGGFSAATEYAAVFGPYLLASLVMGATGIWMSRSYNRAVTTALHAEPPVVKSDEFTTIDLNAPGVSLRAKIDNAMAGDVKFQEKVVESVKASLAVRKS